MPIHQFNDENNYKMGGRFHDGYGRSLATWTWDETDESLTVLRGNIGRTISLATFSPEVVTDDNLRERLPDIAYSTANDIQPFDD